MCCEHIYTGCNEEQKKELKWHGAERIQHACRLHQSLSVNPVGCNTGSGRALSSADTSLWDSGWSGLAAALLSLPPPTKGCKYLQEQASEAASWCFHVNWTRLLFAFPSLLHHPCSSHWSQRKEKRFEACPVCSHIRRCLALCKVEKAGWLPDWHFNTVTAGTTFSCLQLWAAPAGRPLRPVPWALEQHTS